MSYLKIIKSNLLKIAKKIPNIAHKDKEIKEVKTLLSQIIEECQQIEKVLDKINNDSATINIERVVIEKLDNTYNIDNIDVKELGGVLHIGENYRSFPVKRMTLDPNNEYNKLINKNKTTKKTQQNVSYKINFK